MNSSSLSIATCGDYSPVYLSSRTAAYAINVALGLPINCYIMRLIVAGAVGTTSSEFFTVNLLVSELLACLGCVFNSSDVARTRRPGEAESDQREKQEEENGF
ncbi:hypothetical protein Q5P01_025956 [Channa striata]|uniref:Uncharacterized protein n=1 Tax=Channa striata TaxID=64152 RepID=A0AA88LN65_CHASR|nr:hypothetical protein Q5P01_025956 [Channa striata]